VIEAEQQAVLNTLTEHDFRDAFLNWQKGQEWCIRAEGDYFDGDVAIGPNVSFRSDGNISPGNYGWLFVCKKNNSLPY
jgi:hypothetical protein